MDSYSTLFGGNLVAPAIPTYLSLEISEDVELSWPVESIAPGSLVVAEIIDVTATAAGLSITLSNATQISTGYCVLFNNVGAQPVSILNSIGTEIASIASGTAWQIYLSDNSTAAGVWRVFQYGAGISQATAATLAGAGLEAISNTLNCEIVVTPKTASYNLNVSDRASCLEWTGGSGGIFTLPNPATATSGWICYIKNSGTGVLTVTPAAGEINGAASQTFNPNDSAIIACDGNNYFTIGFGQSVASNFNFVSISLAGISGNYVLAGAQLNRISYKFSGAMSGNTTVVVPASIQQYWVDNETTGGTLTVSAGGAGATFAVPSGGHVILYCDGTNIVNATTTSTPQFPDGSDANPSITFSSDTTTGLYKAGSETLGFSTNGAARGSIGSTGTWAIGSPTTGLALTVTGNVTAPSIVQKITTPFSGNQTNPQLLITAEAAGGFAFLSLAANGNIPGTNDFNLFQHGDGLNAFIENNAAGNLTITQAGTGSISFQANNNIVANFSGAHIILGSPTVPVYLNQPTSNSATGGAATALPPNPTGYVTVIIAGITSKIPYYAP